MTVHIGRPAFDVPLHVLLIGTNPEEACRFEEHLRVGDQEATLHWEEDFKTGLQVLGERSLDVLALDLDLPGCEGTEAVRRCVEAAPTIPMVVLTEAEPLGTVRSALRPVRRSTCRRTNCRPSSSSGPSGGPVSERR